MHHSYICKPNLISDKKMNYSTDNTRIIDKVDLVTPNDVISKYPLTDEISKLVYGTRNEVSQILHGKDDRLIAVVGPCSIHDPDSAKEYAKLLIDEKKKYEEDILLIMRVYFEKPRTCLLYTSPSPRDGLLSRMPSSA